MWSVLYDITALRGVRADSTVIILGLDPLTHASMSATKEVALCVCIDERH